MTAEYGFDADLVDAVAAMGGSDISDVVDARRQADAMYGPGRRPFDADAVTVDRRHVPGRGRVDEVEVIVVAPRERSSSDSPPGALLCIHGGGFSIGRAEHDIPFAAWMAGELGIVVALVDYRLAPEHPYPAGLADCLAALEWLHAHAGELGFDPDRLAIYGSSAGATIAAGTALLARDLGGPPLCLQFLAIPVLDDRLGTPSMRQFVDTPIWHRRNAELSWSYYLGDDRDEVSPYASPARAVDLTGLPRTYLTTAEFDPLRDEGLIYAMRLLQAGVSVELHQFAGAYHGSVLVPTAWSSQRQYDEMLEVLRHALCATP